MLLESARTAPGKLTAKKLTELRDKLNLGPKRDQSEDLVEAEILEAELVDEAHSTVQQVTEALETLRRAQRALTPAAVAEALRQEPGLREAVQAGYDDAGQIRRRLRGHVGGTDA